jgi:flagella basal body P-ring formation protein FlgA
MRELSLLPLLLTLWGTPARAQDDADSRAWPVEVEAHVRDAVAAAWEISAERVLMDWGSRRPGAPGTEASVELLGTGLGGYWVARITEPGRDPVSVRIRAGVRVERAVAARRLSRGTTLEPGDIALEEVLRWGRPQPDDPVVQVGWEAQRVIEAGDALVEPAVRPPLAVVSGRPVQILWTRGTVGIRTTGRAAGSGPLGARVSVRTESGRRLTGVIVAPGVVNVTDQAAAGAVPGGVR